MVSTDHTGDAANPYLVAFAVLAPMGAVVTGVAYLLTTQLFAFLLGAGFLGALLSTLGYGVRARLAGDATPN
jgi:hypothetical protein